MWKSGLQAMRISMTGRRMREGCVTGKGYRHQETYIKEEGGAGVGRRSGTGE
ncbi:MAG: hypothetical protein K2K90_14055 [Lachnospiraceae bacterium]|nr:hypothetical protein [Lachnospiraceae bacterium]